MEENEENATVSFSDFGLKFPSSTSTTCLGKIRSLSSLTKLEWSFLVLSMISLLSALGLTIYRIITVDHTSSDFTFGIVLIVNIVFCMYYTINGIFFERPYEIAVLVLATVMLWLYLLLNYCISVKGVFKMVRLIISSGLSPFIIVTGTVIARNYNKSKNLIFRTVGADGVMQEICNTMFIFFGLLKADVQISISLAILSSHLPLYWYVLLPLMIVFGLASSITGYLSVRFENKAIAIVYAVLWIVMPGFAIYMIVAAAKELSLFTDTKMEKSLYTVLFVVAAACWIVRCTCLYFGINAYLGFGRGLKQKVFGSTDLSTSTRNIQQTENA